MSISISNSLNMRTLKEAMESQQEHEDLKIGLSEIEDEVKENNTPAIVPSEDYKPLEKAYNDLTDLDQAVFQHDDESNEVIKMAKDAFNTVFAAAQSVPPEKASYLFEAAGQFLEIINKTSGSKVDSKHNRAKLSIALTKAQLQAGFIEDGSSDGVRAHRNDILKAMIGDNIEEAEFTEESALEPIDVPIEENDPMEIDDAIEAIGAINQQIIDSMLKYESADENTVTDVANDDKENK